MLDARKILTLSNKVCSFQKCEKCANNLKFFVDRLKKIDLKYWDFVGNCLAGWLTYTKFKKNESSICIKTITYVKKN